MTSINFDDFLSIKYKKIWIYRWVYNRSKILSISVILASVLYFYLSHSFDNLFNFFLILWILTVQQKRRTWRRIWYRNEYQFAGCMPCLRNILLLNNIILIISLPSNKFFTLTWSKLEKYCKQYHFKRNTIK